MGEDIDPDRPGRLRRPAERRARRLARATFAPKWGAMANGSSRLHVATLAAIGVLVYVIKNVVHEGLGHGGVCLLVGGEPVAISSAWWDGTYDGVSDWGVRWVAAGGTFANLILAGALLALWRPTHRLRSDRSAFGYFIWLLIVANLLSGGGYMMVDPIGGFGTGRSLARDCSPPGCGAW